VKCVHAALEQGGVVTCTNYEDLVHGGTVPLTFCQNKCPYRKQPDFFNQTARLLVQKAASGEYVPRPRSCGGCDTVKHRNDAVQFVWPYWHGGANGDELRWSIRSVISHFEGQAKITIVGDRPEWWQGHVIDTPRIQQTANWPFRDMLNKMQVIATHREIDSHFVWMMDDVYLIRPVTLAEIQLPRAYGWADNRQNSWQRRKSNTMACLAREGKTQYDYATHLPHHAEQDKLQWLFDRYNLAENTMLWEVLYGNWFRSKPVSPHPFFCRLTQGMAMQEACRASREASVFNHTAGAWCEGIRQFLVDLFPDKAPGESIPSGYVPPFVRKAARKINRPVKRRPAKAKTT
jgi:hypothetical protein